MIEFSKNRKRNSFGFIVILALLIFFGCKKKETTPPAFEIKGNWKVGYYHIGIVDHTNDFSGYSFVFNNDSSIIATHNSINESGTWSYNSSTIQFVITIGTGAPLIEISKNWLLILKSEGELIFDEDSTTNDEELHFIRN